MKIDDHKKKFFERIKFNYLSIKFEKNQNQIPISNSNRSKSISKFEFNYYIYRKFLK